MNSKRIAPGAYEVKVGGDTYEVFQMPEGDCKGWWMFASQSDRYNYSDPVRTKREAMECLQQLASHS
jgi:hypothetical protein